jgi:hypothetical protein
MQPRVNCANACAVCRRLAVAVVAVGAAVAAAQPPPVLSPTRPRVEYTEGKGMHAALGVDALTSPRFGWALDGDEDATHGQRGDAQLAYQLVLTQQGSSAPLWDSGRVLSNRSQHVAPPANVSLAADASYDWKVRCWSRLGGPGGPPGPWLLSTFSTGIGTVVQVNGTGLAWAGAQWVVTTKVRGHGQGNLMRKEFSLPAGDRVVRAALYVACLGYFVAEVNGQAAGSRDKQLGDFTNFEKRVWCVVRCRRQCRLRAVFTSTLAVAAAYLGM